MTANLQPSNDADTRREARRKAWLFGRIAAGILIALCVVLAAIKRFELVGGGFHLNFALVLGALGAILLGVGLMALSFYSDRSGADDGVIGMSRDEWNEENRER
ncbi:MAG: hypothetical protein A3E78_01840 [Alphaproteobacteria bacterium RIFCSPHIGHO2_12_FULL_63_12]|nr:MAG: hypothetical protein A3E78_01840 [Alphaproteobacteria bacterium RIFCSPHIGHO2_12_FULL_63_12]